MTPSPYSPPKSVVTDDKYPESSDFIGYFFGALFVSPLLLPVFIIAMFAAT